MSLDIEQRHREAAEGLFEALRLLLPTDKVDEAIGWRGSSASHNDIFQCEFCKAEHLDMTLIDHTGDCPVTLGRAAIAAFEASLSTPTSSGGSGDRIAELERERDEAKADYLRIHREKMELFDRALAAEADLDKLRGLVSSLHLYLSDLLEVQKFPGKGRSIDERCANEEWWIERQHAVALARSALWGEQSPPSLQIRSVVLTEAQLSATQDAINFVLADAWDESSHQHGADVYEASLDKLTAMQGFRVRALTPARKEQTGEGR